MAKTKKNKTELNTAKTCLIFAAAFNIFGVVGLFLAGYGTASLPAPIANFLLSQMFVYLLNGLLALGVVLCFVGVGKVNAYSKKMNAVAPAAKGKAEKNSDEEELPKEITADDILRVANANHAEELAKKAEEATKAAHADEHSDVGVSTIDDILGNDENPFVTDIRQEPAQPVEQSNAVLVSADQPDEPATVAADEQFDAETEPEAEATAGADMAEAIPVLNELEQMLKEALVKMQIPTAIYGIEEDKEGAVCISCDPKNGEWYIYDIKDGKMVDFVFFAKDKGKAAGKVFLERVTKKMNS